MINDKQDYIISELNCNNISDNNLYNFINTPENKLDDKFTIIVIIVN